MPDNLRHAQYDSSGVQIDNPQDVYPSAQSLGSFTWATKPSAIGNAGAVIRISDAGTLGVSHWISNGTYWRPLNGSLFYSSQQGSIATPISAFTGVASSQFVINQPVFPAGMLVPGVSEIRTKIRLRRTGATATATINVHLGTAKSSSDPVVYAFTYAATNLLDIIAAPSIQIPETGRVMGTNWQPEGGSGNTSTFLDRTTNINTLADMGLTVSISGANAADAFALLGISVELRQ